MNSSKGFLEGHAGKKELQYMKSAKLDTLLFPRAFMKNGREFRPQDLMVFGAELMLRKHLLK